MHNKINDLIEQTIKENVVKARTPDGGEVWVDLDNSAPDVVELATASVPISADVFEIFKKPCVR